MKERTRCRGGVGAVVVLLLAAGWLSADQLEMLNGDRYVGKVLSLNSNTVVWQSDVLGTIKLPRNKVSSINLGSGATVNPVRLPGVALPAGPGDGTGGKPQQLNSPLIRQSPPALSQTPSAPAPQPLDL